MKLSKTLYKQDLKQLRYHNPFKREEKVEIPEQRSLSSLGFLAGNKTQRLIFTDNGKEDLTDP